MIVVYGGSFDPPHEGHRQGIEAVIHEWPNSRIIVIPGAQPAGLNSLQKVPVASFQHRIAMSKIAFQKNSCHNIEISTLEEQMPAPNFTLNTLKYLKENVSSERPNLLLGQDQLRNFSKWHGPLEILKLTDLIIMRRASESANHLTQPSLSDDLNAMSASLELSVKWDEKKKYALLVETQTQVHLLDIQLSHAESSIIRRDISEGIEIPSGWMDNYVMHYIKEQNLYTRR